MPLDFKQIYAVVKLIPKGQVLSYAGVARQCGRPGAQRVVGYAMFALKADAKVPWWRVINAQGRISNSSTADAPNRQRERLRAEGIEVSEAYGVDMKIYDAEDIVYEKLRRKRLQQKKRPKAD
jgi:methylated-DNA-protein-cysteine methyltransferase related protein